MAPLQVGYSVECELVKAGGLLPLRLEARGSAALTVLLRTRSRHAHPDGEATRQCCSSVHRVPGICHPTHVEGNLTGSRPHHAHFNFVVQG